MRKFLSQDPTVCGIKNKMEILKNGNKDCRKKEILKTLFISLGIILAIVIIVALIKNLLNNDEYFYDDLDTESDDEFDDEYLYDDNDFI